MSATPRPRLLLFDIDGTLMLSGGAGKRALTRALAEVFGIADALTGVRLHGQTDPQIVTDALARAGRAAHASDAELARTRALYLQYLEGEIATAEQARLLPGVIELLDELARRPHVSLALLTGNLEAGARIKLSRFALNRYFPCGGFGSDAAERRALVPIAVARARAHFAIVPEPTDVVVIGDTEKDVDCGRAAGARTLAVATGGATAQVLAESGPDLVVDSFADTARVLDALLTL